MKMNIVDDFEWITPDDWYMSDSDCESLPPATSEKKSYKRPNTFTDPDETKFRKLYDQKKTFAGNEPTITLQAQQVLQWKRIIDEDYNFYTRLVLNEKRRNVAYDGDFGFRIRASVLQQCIDPLDLKPYFTWNLETIPLFFLRVRLLKEKKDIAKPVFDIGQPLPCFEWFPLPGKEDFSFGIFPHKIFTNVLKKHFSKVIPRKIENISIETIRYSPRKSVFDLLPSLSSSILSSLKKEFTLKKVLVIHFANDSDPLVLDIFDEFYRNCFGQNLKFSSAKGNVYQGIQYSEYSKIDLSLPDDHPFKKKFYFSKCNLQKVLIKIAPFKQSLKSFTTEDESVNINALAPHFLNPNIRNEVITLKFLTENKKDCDSLHPFPQFIDCLLDRWNLYTISSYQEGSNLPVNTCITVGLPLKQVPREIEQRAKHLFRQVAEQISTLHSFGLSHLDISLDNIILHQQTPEDYLAGRLPRCSLIDLERVISQEYLPHLDRYAVHRPHGKNRINHGKFLYFCPELEDFPGNPFYCGDRFYSPMKVDIWQLGVLLYLLLTGMAPFCPIRGQTEETNHLISNYQRDWFDRIRINGISNFELLVHTSLQGKQCIPLREFFSDGVNQLLTRMLRLDPNERVDIQVVLADPWLQV